MFYFDVFQKDTVMKRISCRYFLFFSDYFHCLPYDFYIKSVENPCHIFDQHQHTVNLQARCYFDRSYVK